MTEVAQAACTPQTPYDCYYIDYKPCPCPPPPPCRDCPPINWRIPDGDPEGVLIPILVSSDSGGPMTVGSVLIDVGITHTFRGDLVVQLISPSGQVVTLSNREGGSADNLVITGRDVSPSFAGGSAVGTWQLFVRDLAALDVGTVDSVTLHIATLEGPEPDPWIAHATDVPVQIPDNSAAGASSVIDVNVPDLDIQRVTVGVHITHTFRGDLVIQVASPSGQVATLSNREGGSADDFVATDRDITASFTPHSPASGRWRLLVRDLAAADVGRIDSFQLAITSSR